MSMRPFPQDPTACRAVSARRPTFHSAEAVVLAGERARTVHSQCSTLSATGGRSPPTWSGRRSVDRRQVLLRKEVIQPHLPVRLPCYDFVPIADPTFDGSLPYGLGHRLRVLPTFVT